MERVRSVCHIIERDHAPVTVQQHANALRTGIGQHGLAAVVPSRQLDVEPLHTPGLDVAAQTTGGTLAVDAAVRQAYADEVVAAQPDLPVVAPAREALGGEHLGADGEPLRAVGVVDVILCHGGLFELLTQCDSLVGRPWIETEHRAI